MNFGARVIRNYGASLLRTIVWIVALCAIAMPATNQVAAQTKYQKPPENILKVLEAPTTPNASVSPAMDYALMFRAIPYPSIADMSQPMLRLAGLRINPLTSGQHNPAHFTDFVLKHIPDGAEVRVALPATGNLGAPMWAPDGKHFIVTQVTLNSTRLWVGDTTGKAHEVAGLELNSILSGGFWRKRRLRMDGR